MSPGTGSGFQRLTTAPTISCPCQALTVVIVFENVVALVAAVHHVLNGVGLLDAQLRGISQSGRQRLNVSSKYKCGGLTPAPAEVRNPKEIRGSKSEAI